jgi:diguanylate cyclase (GGDEF)-like protein
MRILIAEDDSVSRRILESHLVKWGHEVVSTTTGREALEALSDPKSPRLAILDWVMPEMDGTEVVQAIRELPEVPFTFFILLTARDNADDLVSGLESGADAYLTKPYNQEELRARVAGGERIICLQQELECANAKLKHMVRTDALTQISNRKAILESISAELARANRRDDPVAVIMADIDRFKTVNDTYGHVAGDHVLCEVARRLHDACREYDSVGRYGGEEFAMVLPGVDYEYLNDVANRILDAVRSKPIAADGKALTITLSAGGVWLSPEIVWPVDIVMREADRLLYLSKEAGRDRFTWKPLVASVDVPNAKNPTTTQAVS